MKKYLCLLQCGILLLNFFYWHNDLKDWSVFDKTVCGIALTDSDGNVIYGKNPSVSEFQSYDAPREGSVKVGL
ncbi:hypothetical protein [uncultured Fibrobacter sp.]|uniref:hypothetical protein n=1 Tax=uncultured Fibrobacter sp. TaxID=261512 RepID=UPI0025FB42A6|nr:hypothetical protein [uncultured Fibrobacter sp.]